MKVSTVGFPALLALASLLALSLTGCEGSTSGSPTHGGFRGGRGYGRGWSARQVPRELLVVEDPPVRSREAMAELINDDARHAYERALPELKLRETELEEAQAALTAATTRLEQPVHLETPLGEANAALARIETQLRTVPFEIRRAEARLDFAKRNYERKISLKGVVAGRAIDEARSALAEATASLEECRAQEDSLRKERKALADHRDALKTQLELRVAEVQAKREAEARLKTAQARVKQAAIHLAEAKRRLDRMTGRAAVDGRILDLVVQPGTK